MVYLLSLCQKSQRMTLQWQRCCEVSSLVWMSTVMTRRQTGFQLFPQGMPDHPLMGTQSE